MTQWLVHVVIATIYLIFKIIDLSQYPRDSHPKSTLDRRGWLGDLFYVTSDSPGPLTCGLNYYMPCYTLNHDLFVNINASATICLLKLSRLIKIPVGFCRFPFNCIFKIPRLNYYLLPRLGIFCIGLRQHHRSSKRRIFPWRLNHFVLLYFYKKMITSLNYLMWVLWFCNWLFCSLWN